MKQPLSRRPKSWTSQEKQQLEKLARRRFSASEIAIELGRHIAAVRKMAREMKLLLRKEGVN